MGVYRNWLGLMKGDLTEEVAKGGKTFTRKLNPDVEFLDTKGAPTSLAGRSLMLVRNVGHLMTNPAITFDGGREVPEGIMDALVTGLIALHDIGPNGRRMNSRAGSMYVVKPKMHGRKRSPSPAKSSPCRTGARHGAEHDEDGHHGRGASHDGQPQGKHSRCPRTRRLHQHRLPRSHRRRMHTSMEAGPMIRKGDMKQAAWISATKTGTSISAWNAASPAALRSARACGPCRT